MKKLLLLILTSISSLGFAQLPVTASPKYGCPNTTHNVSVTVTNNSGFSIPAGATVSITINNPSSSPIGSYNGTSAGIPNGGTETYVVTAIPFGVAGTYTVTGTASITVPISLTYPFSSNYVVQTPPDLSITESPAGTVSASGSTDYSVRFYLDANPAFVNETTGSTYIAGADGSYTAKAYEPISQCISANYSNTISVVTSVENKLSFQVSVYPNPMVSELSLKAESAVGLSYEITDLSGKSMLTGNFSNSTKVNTETLVSGVYLLKIKDASGNYNTYKISK